MARVLVIDDDKIFSRMICDLVESRGHEVSWVGTLEDGLSFLRKSEIDLVLLDVRLPDGNGLKHIPQIQSAASTPEVIIMTAFGDRDGAELAIKSGAWDYLEKASGLSMLTLPVVRALQYREAKMLTKTPGLFKRSAIRGNSPSIRSCIEFAAKLSSSDASVLVIGETGTGKELFSRAIHENSNRCGMNFVIVDCAAMPPNLVENALFGHEKGAFTGADRFKAGLLKHADGGTLFLDEIGELPLDIQKSFLRVLQERKFRPVGGIREVESRFRLVAATNRDLNSMAEEGLFRRDLLFRLGTSVLKLPPLREHKTDITELAMTHVSRLCRRYKLPLKGFSPDFLEVLFGYRWPGNVRELFHSIESAFAAAGDQPTLFAKHLPVELRLKARNGFIKEETTPKESAEDQFALETPPPSLQEVRAEALAAAEKSYVVELLKRCPGDIKAACKHSGLSRSQFYRLMQKHQIRRSFDGNPG
jgi:two-component system, NtrC family, response regulator